MRSAILKERIVIWQDFGALATLRKKSSGSAGDEIIESLKVYSKENYSKRVWNER